MPSDTDRQSTLVEENTLQTGQDTNSENSRILTWSQSIDLNCHSRESIERDIVLLL